jgi:fructose-1,6-bisphosphatase/inositol monophosphatase family enzyme
LGAASFDGYAGLTNEKPSDEYKQQAAAVAEAAARKAGELMLKGLGLIDLSSDVESKIGSRDIVTAVDKEVKLER